MDNELKRDIILDNYNNPSNRQRHDNDDYTKITSFDGKAFYSYFPHNLD